MSPVRQLIDMANMVNTLWPQVELAIQVLEVEPEIKEPSKPQQLPPRPLTVEVEDLVYKPSPDGPPILAASLGRGHAGRGLGDLGAIRLGQIDAVKSDGAVARISSRAPSASAAATSAMSRSPVCAAPSEWCRSFR